MVSQFEAEKKQLKNAKAANLKVSFDDLETETETEIFRLAASSFENSPRKDFIFDSLDDEGKDTKLIGSALKSSYLSMLSQGEQLDQSMHVQMSAERARWEKGKEARYQSEKQNVQQLVQMVTQSENYGDSGFRAVLNRVLHPEYTGMLREQVLSKYTEGDLLIPAHIKYLALTSNVLIDYLENQGYQFFFKVLDPELVRRLELQILKNIVETYFETRATLAEENRKLKFNILPAHVQQGSHGPPTNVLIKELNSKAAVRRVLESRLFYVQKKKVFKLIREIQRTAPVKLITPDDIRKLAAVFAKRREMFSGYRAYLNRPEDRFSSPQTSVATSRPNTANSRPPVILEHVSGEEPSESMIRLEDQAKTKQKELKQSQLGWEKGKLRPKTAIVTTTHSNSQGLFGDGNKELSVVIGELSNLIDRPVSAHVNTRLRSGITGIERMPDLNSEIEDSNKKLNRTLKMVKKLVVATEERLKEKQLHKKHRNRNITVDGRIVLSELKKLTDYSADDEASGQPEVSKAKSLAVERCVNRMFVHNQPSNRYFYTKIRPISADNTEKLAVPIVSLTLRKADQEAQQKQQDKKNRLLTRLRPPNSHTGKSLSDARTTSTSDKTCKQLFGGSVMRDKPTEALETAKQQGRIPPGLSTIQAEILLACRRNSTADMEKFLLRMASPGERLTAVSGDCGHDEAPLDLVVKHRNLPLAELLLSNGADPNRVFKNGETPLHAACRLGDRKVAHPYRRCSRNS